MPDVKAVILRYSDMSLSALTQLKKWLRRSGSLKGMDVDTFSNPTLQIAQATSAAGETVCYCTVEQAFVVGTLALNPQTTEEEMHAAASTIEAAIAHQAGLVGISRLFMVVPNNLPSQPGEKYIRVVERTITPAVNALGMLGHFAPSQAPQYLN